MDGDVEMSDGGSSAKRASNKEFDNPAFVEKAPVEPPSPPSEKAIDLTTTCGLVFIWFLSAAPFLLIMILFSGIGYGISVFETLTDLYEWTGFFVPVTLIMMITLYIFDYSHWDTDKAWVYVLKTFVTVFLIGMLGACAAFASKNYPPLLLSYVILLIPGWFYLIQCLTVSSEKLKEEKDAHLFLEKIWKPLVLYSIVIFVYWFIWVLWKDMPALGNWINVEEAGASSGRGHFYSSAVSRAYALQLGCASEAEVADDEVDIECTLAYLIWISPFIMALTSMSGGLISYFMYRQRYKITHHEKTRYGKLKVFSILLLTILGAMWVAASVAGAGQLSSAFYALAAAGIIVLCLVVVAGFGTEGLSEEVSHVPILKALMDEVRDGEILKGLLVITCILPILMYFAVSVVNQFVRKYICVGACGCVGLTKFSKDKEEDHLASGHYLTKQANDYVEKMKKWHFVNVMVWAIYWGIFFVTVQIGIGLVTTIVLSALNEYLDGFSLLFTVVIFYIVGFTMFLLPPVPGVPVYLAGGVIIVNAAQDDFGFTGAIFFMIFVGWSLKMMAIMTQQKVFGEYLCKRFVSARAFVKINSTTMRAVKKILERPGMDIAKVSILVGGPDWPTSTLTGIMGLPLGPMLYGSQPIVFLIAPCVVAGAFLLRTGGVWDSLGSIALTFSAITQGGALVVAAYFIQEEVEKFPQEGDPDFVPFEPDLEVLELDKKNEEAAVAYKKVTVDVPWYVKLILWVSFVTQAMVCYLVGLLYTSCFAPFGVSSSIEEDLDGNVGNVILSPYGYMAIYLFVVSSVTLIMFKQWASYGAKSLNAQPSAEGETV